MKNIIMLSDSYKYSHFKQYPENMVSMYDYAEARSDKVYPKTVFFGLQYYIKKYLMNPFTAEDIKVAKEFAERHGIPFDIVGWNYILEEHNGFLPVKIRAVPEGEVIPTGHPLFTVESTDTAVPWVAGFLETLLMKVWYTSNIATRSYYVKQIIRKYWEETVEDKDMFGINFAYHNFGDRGSSSVESAGIGGVAHLTQFKGTDNFSSLLLADEFYQHPEAGFSIPATEHSTTTSWGRENEAEMIMKHIETNKDSPVIAAVCDSYNYIEMVKKVTSGEFKEKIESDEYPKFVIRPDSGDPVTLIEETLDIMVQNGVDSFVNEKGYIEFKKYGIIWGDGIDDEVIEKILKALTSKGFSANIIAFGSGGWLMTQHDRDTQGWAIKCSEITVDEGSAIDNDDGTTSWEPFFVTRDVYKDPVTAPNKKSKKGKVTTFFNPVTKDYFVDQIGTDEVMDNGCFDVLQDVYENGRILVVSELREVRERSQQV